jgi:hypothetical protein
MLGLQLRDEFRGPRLRGTTIDFTNEAKTGALDMAAQDFLRITYPSVDLIKTIKAAAPGSNRAVVLIGDKGQGKSHLMAALCHLLSDSSAGEAWLKDWSDSSNAAQQLFRVNPVRVDFKGEQAQHDRRRLLLYRIFENRINIADTQIAPLVDAHFSEFMRLGQRPASEVEKHRARFVEAWPYSPELLQLLDDEVIFAIKAQGTRDLVRILVELFKTAGETVPVITPADFELSGDDRGSAAALIDNVGIDHHKQLRDRALRNLTAVEEALGGDLTSVPHLREVLTSLWLRSLSLDNQRVGADPETLQIDVTRKSKVDDNAFQAELATIEGNSYNIHKTGSRLVFKLEENARTRLMAHARNDKLFQNGEDVDFLAAEIRHAIGGDVQISGLYRTIVLKREWNNTPWDEVDESLRPNVWDNKIPLIILPAYPDKLNATLGTWLGKFLGVSRNTVRFLLPKKGSDGASAIYQDKELMLAARAASLAKDWARTEAGYKPLSTEFLGALKTRIAERFDRFAILSVWNHEDAAKCEFSVEPHGTKGDKIPPAIQEKIKQNLFVHEDFDELVVSFAEKNLSMAKLLGELREPRGGGKQCIPWLGEAEAKDATLAVCAAGQIAIHVRGLKTLQLVPGETGEIALRRMKRDFDVTGKQLEETTLAKPGSSPSSSGQTPTTAPTPGTQGLLGIPGLSGAPVAPSPTGVGDPPPNPFGGGSPATGGGGGMPVATTTKLSADPTSGLNLLSRVVDTWRVGPATTVRNVTLHVDKLTGAQLQQLIQNLPNGLLFGLDADKEDA